MSLFTVVTCMGRLAHLQRSLPAFPKPCVVVDYSCPDRSGDWAEAQGVTVMRVPGEKFFHKTRALNVGARRAIELGATRLAFLDADTLVQPGFELLARTKTACLIAPPGSPSLVGVLVVPQDDFVRALGYDEAYQGWGCEDLAMRLQLHVTGSVFETIPVGLLGSIHHDDQLRTHHYVVKNHLVSRVLNAKILERRIWDLTGKGPADLDDRAKELLRVL